MEFFFPSVYFDLSFFKHASLFDLGEPVWRAIEKIEPYLRSLILGKIEGEVSRKAYLIKPEEISIGKGSVVEPGAYIQGPCLIGENCQIRHGAYIRGNVITGNGCVIGHATEMKNTLFLDDVSAGHFAYVGDSIIGNRVNLGAGTKCANLRIDRKLIRISWKGEFFDSGLRKMGAILGDDVQTGCNSVTNPGTLMGKESRLSPCTTASAVVCKKSVIKSPEVLVIQHS